MKKVVSFRLSEAARKRLAELAAERRMSAGRILEDLILGEPPGSVAVEPPKPKPPMTTERRKPVVTERSASPGTSHVLRRKIVKVER